MPAARVILVSDSHGDLSLDGARDATGLRHGRAQLDRLPAPWLAVPGNHDIGDNPSPGTPAALLPLLAAGCPGTPRPAVRRQPARAGDERSRTPVPPAPPTRIMADPLEGDLFDA